MWSGGRRATAPLLIKDTMNIKIQLACHPDDVKHYDTERLRKSFLMEKVMAADEINLTYTLYDRMIYGGIMPVDQVLRLETFNELKAEHFLDRRELGVINVGGNGVVSSSYRATSSAHVISLIFFTPGIAADIHSIFLHSA